LRFLPCVSAGLLLCGGASAVRNPSCCSNFSVCLCPEPVLGKSMFFTRKCFLLSALAPFFCFLVKKRGGATWRVSFSQGALAQTVVYPLDLLRRRLQVEGMNTTGGKGKASSGAAAEASRRVVADSTWLALQRIVKEGGGASRSHCFYIVCLTSKRPGIWSDVLQNSSLSKYQDTVRSGMAGRRVEIGGIDC
jgi:hypothetical protein